MSTEKSRESRLRRMAERQGLRLERSRRRDLRAVDFGTYRLVDPNRNVIVAGDPNHGYGLDLDAVEHQLTGAEILDNEADMLLADPGDVVQETVPLTPAELADLDAAAARLGVTRHALIRQAVREGLRQHDLKG